MGNYSTQLKQTGWQKKRLEILNDRGWICEECGAKDVEALLDVHHIKYLKGRKAWQYSNSNFVVLCRSCHTIEHKTKSSGNIEEESLTKDTVSDSNPKTEAYITIYKAENNNFYLLTDKKPLLINPLFVKKYLSSGSIPGEING